MVRNRRMSSPGLKHNGEAIRPRPLDRGVQLELEACRKLNHARRVGETRVLCGLTEGTGGDGRGIGTVVGMIEQVEGLRDTDEVIALSDGKGLLQACVDTMDRAADERVALDEHIASSSGRGVVVGGIVVDLCAGRKGSIRRGAVEKRAAASVDSISRPRAKAVEAGYLETPLETVETVDVEGVPLISGSTCPLVRVAELIIGNVEGSLAGALGASEGVASGDSCAVTVSAANIHE